MDNFHEKILDAALDENRLNFIYHFWILYGVHIDNVSQEILKSLYEKTILGYTFKIHGLSFLNEQLEPLVSRYTMDDYILIGSFNCANNFDYLVFYKMS